ncbi:trypsin-like serine peptidase [Burkholderia stagnalis]|uniref:trypsin-like serine peptidase n=1 Tax=Burkholderia stagnalis TaxID=1503054 RepID=UPI000B09D1C3|nr:trypsin-like serine protease [Burkholderia stagnalis]MDY7804106.1 trypsin-like serine protease [Burkholderia stagnalis]
MSKLINKIAVAALGSLLATGALAQQIRTHGAVTQITLPERALQVAAIDFKNAKPMPLPRPITAPASMLDSLMYNARPALGVPGFAQGGAGDGKQRPVQLVAPIDLSQTGVQPQEFGTSNQPYTTSQVNAYGNNTQYYYPFRAAGKLFFNIGSATYLCSASLIKPGVVVTAAHCVANFGQRQFYSNWVFVPAYSNGSAPYGTWYGASATVMTSYYDGSDPCAVAGVICQDDIAVIVLSPQGGSYAGNSAGWYGYGWNGYSYNPSGFALIDQLGYPVALDSGVYMERNESQGFVSASNSNNTIIGSLMTGGSSGGPWLVNLGMPPALSGTGFGNAASHNVVVGVTSWGYTDTTVKQQGASPFTSGNIVTLVNTVCGSTPAAC